MLLTFLVSFVRLLPLAIISPSLVMTHLVHHTRQSENRTLASCIEKVCGCQAGTDPHPIGTSPRASAFLACIGTCVTASLQQPASAKRAWLSMSAHLSKGLTHKGHVFCRP